MSKHFSLLVEEHRFLVAEYKLWIDQRQRVKLNRINVLKGVKSSLGFIIDYLIYSLWLLEHRLHEYVGISLVLPILISSAIAREQSELEFRAILPKLLFVVKIRAVVLFTIFLGVAFFRPVVVLMIFFFFRAVRVLTSVLQLTSVRV